MRVLGVFIMCLFLGQLFGQSLAQKLGYPEDARLLIIHSDDLAVSHSENQASFLAYERGSVRSASVMIPCPWLPEVADYSQAHPEFDLGLHLTLTSEWKHYKWGPVSSIDDAASIINTSLHFHPDCASMAEHATAQAVEGELRAQIAQAIRVGIDPTHLDSHMGCLFFSRPEFFTIYQQLGREYRIPTMVSSDMVRMLPEAARNSIAKDDIVVDRIISAGPQDVADGAEAYYSGILKTLASGVTVLIIHTAFDDAEMEAITVDHPDWGSAWRQADYDFFTSNTCKKLIEDNGIHLITWREIRDKVIRK